MSTTFRPPFSSTALRKQLHWLPLEWCIVTRHLNFQGTTYWSHAISHRPRATSSAHKVCMLILFSPTIYSVSIEFASTRRTTDWSSLGDRAFLVAAARAWNSLPSTVTAASTLHSFRRALKTHLFTASFPPS